MKYIFLHVPKTAGTALRESLEARYAESEVAYCYGRGEIPAKLQLAINDRKKLIYGHIDFGHLDEVTGAEAYKLLAFFRHPVDRCISTYIHFLHAPSDHERREEAKRMGGFEGFLHSDFGKNWQCQYIAGAKNNADLIDQPEELFRRARTNFDRISWVGVTERYSDSLITLQHFLGLKGLRGHKSNISRDKKLKKELEDNFSKAILDQNSMDLRLWQLANERLDNQLKNVEDLWVKRLLRKINLW